MAAELLHQHITIRRAPKKLKQTNTIATSKPGKATNKPENYLPIALQRATYKLLERLVLKTELIQNCHIIF